METKIKYKNQQDVFDDIRGTLKASGLNIRFFANSQGLPYSTVRFALAGYPKTERSAAIRAKARKAAASIQATIKELFQTKES